METATFALHNTLQVFTIDTDREIILESIGCADDLLYAAYSDYLSLAFIVAPILTFGFLLSFLKNVSAYFQYLLKFFRPVYAFSQLNERSLALGQDLRRNHPRAVLVYTDVREKEEDNRDELTESARELRAVCFKKDILSVGFSRHYKKAPITFFALGEKEAENIDQGVKLISQYHGREYTELYVFSSGIEGELLLMGAEKGSMKVRRVNEERSLVHRLLDDQREELFRRAVPSLSGGPKTVSAVIVGLGRQGTEMLKALSWYCQMDGYTVRIDAFDGEENAEDRFRALAPELMDERFNGTCLPEEAQYTIRIHSGCDVTTKSFADQIGALKETTYVFVTLGSDEANIRTAVALRTQFERMGIRPRIQAVVYRSAARKNLDGVTNFKGQPYNIEFVGDLESSCSEAVILHSQLEEEALRAHMKWGASEDSFWEYEYNYNSSIATALHRRARIACGIPGADKAEEDLTPQENAGIARLEHRRWNAYMRAEGYVYSGSTEKTSRNDLGKSHFDLVPFYRLSEKEQRKDIRVATK